MKPTKETQQKMKPKLKINDKDDKRKLRNVKRNQKSTARRWMNLAKLYKKELKTINELRNNLMTIVNKEIKDITKEEMKNEKELQRELEEKGRAISSRIARKRELRRQESTRSIEEMTDVHLEEISTQEQNEEGQEELEKVTQWTTQQQKEKGKDMTLIRKKMQKMTTKETEC